jgi:ubiquinone biosynthesis protein
VLGRFGPKLPRLVEAALIAQAEPPRPLVAPRRRSRWYLIPAAFVIFAAGIGTGIFL